MIWKCEICGEKFDGHVIRHTTVCFVLSTIELIRLRRAVAK